MDIFLHDKSTRRYFVRCYIILSSIIYTALYFAFICLYFNPNDLDREFVILIIGMAIWSIY